MQGRRRHRLKKVLAWGFLATCASLAGALWFAYVYVTDSDTIPRLIRGEAPKFLPGSVVDVGRARVRPFGGEIHLLHVSLRQSIDGRVFEAVRIPWLNLRHNARALLDGRFEPTEVVVAQPTLRLRRRADGSWNLQGLFANPFPVKGMLAPPIALQNGTVELVSDDAPAGTGTGAAPAGTAANSAAVLREVTGRLEPAGPGKYSFDLSARGDTFGRVTLRGMADLKSGRIDLVGELTRLSLSETLRGRLPAEYRPAYDQLGLTGGEVDLTVGRFTFDPAGSPALTYAVSGRLRSCLWNCPKMPFPLGELGGGFALRDGVLSLNRLEGYYGTTSVRVDRAECDLADVEQGPFSVEMEVLDLELDDRLRERTPPEYQSAWKAFSPKGRVSLSVSAARETRGGPVRRKVECECDDVATEYEHFRYPLDHVRGRLVWEGDQIRVVRLYTLVGGQPISATGTIDHPGPNAVVNLAFAGQGLPIDDALFRAMPPDVRKVVQEFQPSGSVRGTATLRRTPPEKPGDDPRGKVAVDAILDLNERCNVRWVGMPYPVNNLTGRLEIHPDLWEFKNMRGIHGQAVITGSGKVVKLPGPGNRLNVDLHLNAEKLPFDDELRDSLQPAWRKSWAILDPTGSCDVDATIHARHGQRENVRLVIVPRPATDVRLRYSREPKPGDPGGQFELRLEDVTGRFVFNNGPVDMKDVGFTFHGTPVQFDHGRVVVEDSGKFELGVSDLWVKDIRLDSRLRTIMPPVMAQFAQRLDDGRTFTVKGNMGLGWSGRPGAPVRCSWDNALVVFNDNSIQIQPGVGVEHLQGQIDHVQGWTDGSTFDLHGALQLASVVLLGQQITGLESPIDVEHGEARLDNIRGDLLGGRIEGKIGITLDATPKYSTAF
ncbi:MAG: hypothetical protein U0835_27030, partial [Isosphaeraceae bacterium]